MKHFFTDNFSNKCECGKIVKMEKWVRIIEGEEMDNIIKTVNVYNPKGWGFATRGATERIYPEFKGRTKFLGICKCGNLFLHNGLSPSGKA